MDKTSFGEEVYSVVASIPPGRVLTYGQIAYLIGKPQCSRMVGQAMHNAPEEQNLPCHRVVNSQGRLAPFWPEQRELLEKEGTVFKKNGCVDIKASRLGNIEGGYFLANILMSSEQLVSKIPVPTTPVQPNHCQKVPARKVPVEPPMK